eukprot:11032635-Alexandrium_andersonii.AAC.1
MSVRRSSEFSVSVCRLSVSAKRSPEFSVSVRQRGPAALSLRRLFQHATFASLMACGAFCSTPHSLRSRPTFNVSAKRSSEFNVSVCRPRGPRNSM